MKLLITATKPPGGRIFNSCGVDIGTVAGEQGDAVVLKIGERNATIAHAAISQGAPGL